MHYKNIEVEWLGHSGFLIKSDKVIYIDPFQINVNEKADIILITHDHYDHCSLQDLDKVARDGTVIICSSDCQSKINRLKQDVDVQIISPGKSLVVKGVNVKAIPAYNKEKQFHRKEDEWNGYLIDFNNVRIYHAGDTDFIPEMSQLNGVDIAMLPIGGNFTMDAEEAVKAAEIIRPKIALPMHYASIVGTGQDAEKFVQLCQAKGIKAEILEKK